YQSFNNPQGLFVDSSVNIIIADAGNNRITKWDSSGNAIGWIGNATNGWQTGTGATTGPGAPNDYQSFKNPQALFIDASGTIFVADGGANRITKWDSSGNAIG